MAQKDLLEETFRSIGEYFASQNPNIVTGLTVGIELETRGRNFYMEKYEQTKSELLRFLADQELSHLRALENVKEIIEKRSQWSEVRAIQLKLFGRPHLFKGERTEPRISEGSTYRDILLAALSVERQSEEFYTRMAEKVKDDDAKTFFTALAGFERQHYDLIKEFTPKAVEGGVVSRLREGVAHKHTQPRRFRRQR